MKHLIIALMLVSLAGCQSSPSGGELKYQYRPIEGPEKNKLEPIKRRLGQFIIDTWPLLELYSINIENDIYGTAPSAKKFSKKENQSDIRIKSGRALLTMRHNGYDYYSGDAEIDYNGTKQTTKGGLAVSQENGEAKAFFVSLDHKIVQPLETTSPIRFHQADPIFGMPLKGYQKAILFLGLSQGQLKFKYVEYDGNKIQENATEHFSYDYEPGKKYSIKSAKFIVHEATVGTISMTQTALL